MAPRRIRVNSIAPGAIRTPINTAARATREAYDALLSLIPQKRIGEPEEIGRAAVWLVSDQSDYDAWHHALRRWRHDAVSGL